MNKVIENVIHTSKIEKKVFYVLVLLLLILASLYAYFVNETVMNVVQRRDIQREMSDISSRVGGLEFEYMKYKDTITLSYTKTLGFAEAQTTKYISRRSDSSRFTLGE